MRSVGKEGVIKQMRTVNLLQGKQKYEMFRERKEFDVTGPGFIWEWVMGCEARKDGHIHRDFGCLAKT